MLQVHRVHRSHKSAVARILQSLLREAEGLDRQERETARIRNRQERDGIAEGIPDLAAELGRVSMVNGDEFLQLTSGACYKVLAASRCGGRG